MIGAAQVAAPVPAPPLYDGVVPLEPYLWAAPPPDHPGGAQGAAATIGVSQGGNDLVALATPELTPQAQVFAVPGSLTLPAETTSIEASITPLGPSVEPPDGYLDGNVYRIVLTDQAGSPITADASARVSILLRSADPTLADATIARLDGGAWRPLTTSPPSLPGGGFLAVVTRFGDFAVVARGVSPYPTGAAPSDGSGPATGVTASPAAPPTAATARPGKTPTPLPAGPATDDRTGGAVGLLPAAIGVVIVLLAAGVVIARRGRRRPYMGARPVRGRDRR